MFRSVVEAVRQRRAVTHQRLIIVGARRQRAAEGRGVVDNAPHLVGVDRLDDLVGVVGEALQALRQRRRRLADIGEALERRVHVGGVVDQCLREGACVRQRRMNLIGVILDQLVGPLEERVRRAGEAVNIVDDAADLIRLDCLHKLVSIIGKDLQTLRQGLDCLADVGKALERRLDVLRVVVQRLGESADARERRMNIAGVVRDQPVGPVENRVGFAGHALDIVDNAADLLSVDRLDQLVGVVGEALQARRQRLDRLAEIRHALQRRVHAVRVVGQRFREDFHVLERRVNRLGVVDHQLVCEIEHVSGLRLQIPECRRRQRGDDGRVAGQFALALLAADQRDCCRAGQTLRLELRLGVRIDGGALVGHVDVGDDLARVAWHEAELRHLADLEAVEENQRPLGETRDRTVEDDLIASVRARRAVAGDPHHKQKTRDDDAEGEGADHDKVGTRLH